MKKPFTKRKVNFWLEESVFNSTIAMNNLWGSKAERVLMTTKTLSLIFPACNCLFQQRMKKETK
ncbi:CLUMA_CG012234, isoform A [Clunio marinus]|uniref:CLUMA_CG012234, isoform A n=1 Tax=Clunio marinus TaxID=568069 RepID=A0A1J1IF36_9DIPT|nr:CLUMA_CG012234, isoform A [Clunio marinus]